MKALLNALGRFDSHWAFHGVALQESAPTLSFSTLSAQGYTPEKYRDAYIDILSTGAAALPTSRMFWFMTFFPKRQDYIASVANAVASKGVIMGGPDVLPDDAALKERSHRLAGDVGAGVKPTIVEPSRDTGVGNRRDLRVKRMVGRDVVELMGCPNGRWHRDAYGDHDREDDQLDLSATGNVLAHRVASARRGATGRGPLRAVSHATPGISSELRAFSGRSPAYTSGAQLHLHCW